MLACLYFFCNKPEGRRNDSPNIPAVKLYAHKCAKIITYLKLDVGFFIKCEFFKIADIAAVEGKPLRGYVGVAKRARLVCYACLRAVLLNAATRFSEPILRPEPYATPSS